MATKTTKASGPIKPSKTKEAGKAVASAGEKPEKSTGEKLKRPSTRGAAPWATRHAAKYAEEARARAAEPAPPGSARATLREPEGAQLIKDKINALYGALTQIKTLRKNLPKHFYEVGKLLADINERRLYQARGFASFEALIEREIGMPKGVALGLVRATEVFQEEAAIQAGMDKVLEAVNLMDAEEHSQVRPKAAVGADIPLPPRPFVSR